LAYVTYIYFISDMKSIAYQQTDKERQRDRHTGEITQNVKFMVRVTAVFAEVCTL